MPKLSYKIANTLKALRQEKAWSLSLASEKTGVSKAMLGQIEREESSPTISTLWKIATGFGVSFSSFVDELQSEHEFLHRKENLKGMSQQDSKIKVTPLFAYDPILKFEVFIIELLPGCEHLSVPHQKGIVEHVITSSGEIEVLINKTWHKVKQNEGLRFNADKAHGYRNVTQKSAVFHNIVYYP